MIFPETTFCATAFCCPSAFFFCVKSPSSAMPFITSVKGRKEDHLKKGPWKRLFFRLLDCLIGHLKPWQPYLLKLGKNDKDHSKTACSYGLKKELWSHRSWDLHPILVGYCSSMEAPNIFRIINFVGNPGIQGPCESQNNIQRWQLNISTYPWLNLATGSATSVNTRHIPEFLGV